MTSKPKQMVRRTSAGVLSGVARLMAVGSQLTDKVADRLRSHDDRPGAEPQLADEVLEDVGQDRQTDAAQRAAVRPPPTEPVPDVSPHVRTHETHIEEVAAGTAAEVIQTIPELSTDELRRLYEHESDNKQRKTVLQAVERALSPAGGQ